MRNKQWQQEDRRREVEALVAALHRNQVEEAYNSRKAKPQRYGSTGRKLMKLHSSKDRAPTTTKRSCIRVLLPGRLRRVVSQLATVRVPTDGTAVWGTVSYNTRRHRHYAQQGCVSQNLELDETNMLWKNDAREEILKPEAEHHHSKKVGGWLVGSTVETDRQERNTVRQPAAVYLVSSLAVDSRLKWVTTTTTSVDDGLFVVDHCRGAATPHSHIATVQGRQPKTTKNSDCSARARWLQGVNLPSGMVYLQLEDDIIRTLLPTLLEEHFRRPDIMQDDSSSQTSEKMMKPKESFMTVFVANSAHLN
ncbi:unnamed protein product [Heligmosomoides polygyrus]|uniref:DDE_Tnp_1_7 domain-containing protein n=1 Tax=Heligmosomoides polygyrus TaxID=6339 RepID=A0A183G038_HELPZ|nr:unnamed protein product [Heligmosomoides polygyrus]